MSDAGPANPIRARVDALFDRLKNIESALRGEIGELREENEQQQANIEELQREVASLRSRTNLIEHITDAAEKPPEQRAAVLIQTLHNEAQQRAEAETKDGAAAKMDYKQAEKALGGGVERSTIYYTFQTADRLVDSDAVRYVEEPRHSDLNSRLVLDLDAGAIPSRFDRGVED